MCEVGGESLVRARQESNSHRRMPARNARHAGAEWRWAVRERSFVSRTAMPPSGRGATSTQPLLAPPLPLKLLVRQARPSKVGAGIKHLFASRPHICMATRSMRAADSSGLSASERRWSKMTLPRATSSAFSICTEPIGCST